MYCLQYVVVWVILRTMASTQTLSRTQPTATIAASETTSSAIDLADFVLCAIQTPSAMTGSSLTFEGSSDGVTYAAVKDPTNTALSVTISTGAVGLYVLNPQNFAGIRFLKIVSGSPEASARTLQLLGYR